MTKNIEKECPICEQKIDEEHFMVRQLRIGSTLKEAELVWLNKLFVIPCCSCYELMIKTIPRHKRSYKLFKVCSDGFKNNYPAERDYLVFEISMGIENMNYIMLDYEIKKDIPIIIKNLIKFGVI